MNGMDEQPSSGLFVCCRCNFDYLILKTAYMHIYNPRFLQLDPADVFSDELFRLCDTYINDFNLTSYKTIEKDVAVVNAVSLLSRPDSSYPVSCSADFDLSRDFNFFEELRERRKKKKAGKEMYVKVTNKNLN